MVRNLIKKSISEKGLEKILRAKQYFKDSHLFGRGFSILPPTGFRLGDEVISVSPASSITLKGWRKLIQLYKKANASEQQDFRKQAREMILANSNSSVILGSQYVHKIFAGEDAMYYDLLGTAYYANGDLKKAFECFAKLQELEPSDIVFLRKARCMMHFGTADQLIDLLIEGCNKYPKSNPLLMSLANAYYRNGKTDKANETLKRIDAASLKYLRDHSHHIDILQGEIDEVLANKTVVRPVERLGFQAYTEESVLGYWEELYFHFTAKNRFQHGWSDLCYITEKKISDYIDKYKDIKNVLNFGVFCAVPDYNLSQKYPSVNFLGFDREQSTKNYNDAAFSAPNLSFYAMDMIDLIYEDKHEVKDFVRNQITKGEMMIFHARTTTLIYPEAVKRFYKSCANNGVKYIAVYENMCLSRNHLQYYDFENMPADAIPYYSIMMVHNYKKYLEEAGYEIVEREVWGYSELLWEGKDLYGVDHWLGLGDGHVCLLARLKK